MFANDNKSEGADAPPTGAGSSESPFALCLMLRRAHAHYAATMADALRPLGIGIRHLSMLMLLVGRGPTAQRELSELTGFDKATVVRIVDDLEAAGLAVRRPVPGDRRVRSIAITPRGQEVYDEARLEAAGSAERLVSHLPAADAVRLVELLTRFVRIEERTT